MQNWPKKEFDFYNAIHRFILENSYRFKSWVDLEAAFKNTYKNESFLQKEVDIKG